MNQAKRAATPVTRDWLEERGLLHDARVSAVRHEEDRTVIVIDDEWANDHDEEDQSDPGEFWLYNPTNMTGDLHELADAWLSQVELLPDGILQIDSDRGRMLVRVKSIGFVSLPKPT